jgi:hypothetical protein
MNNKLLYNNQYTEEYLIQNRICYDSWKCIRTHKNLSPYFCFKYLYDTPEYDSADDWIDYSEIYKYLKNRNYDDKFIENEFNRAMNDRKN